MEKLSQIPHPALAGVIREKTKRGAIAKIKNCVYSGANMIDLHLSCLEDASENTLREIILASSIPVLALNYNSNYDWSCANFTEEERIESLITSVKSGASGVDIQGYTYHLPSKSGFCGEDKYSFTKGNPREIITDEELISKQCELIEKIHGMGAQVLLSCHPGIAMKCEQVVDLALFLEKRNPDIIKIVTIANTEEEMLEGVRTMLELKKRLKTPVSYHCSGKKGALTRILNPILGGQIAFCVDGYSESSTFEQIDLKTAKQVVDGMQKIL